jgi:hypothetical protein
MPCLLVLLVVAFPRIAIALLWFFTNFFSGIFDTLLWPLLGFIFLPLTLLAYTYMVRIHHVMDSTFLVVMLLAVVIDLGLLGGGEWHRRSRY